MKKASKRSLFWTFPRGPSQASLRFVIAPRSPKYFIDHYMVVCNAPQEQKFFAELFFKKATAF